MGILILISLLGYLSLSTTGQVRDMVFRERLHRAETAANSIDALLHQAVHQLENAARLDALSEGETLQESQPAILESLVHIMGTYDRLWLVNWDGTLLWTSAVGEEDLLAEIVH